MYVSADIVLKPVISLAPTSDVCYESVSDLQFTMIRDQSWFRQECRKVCLCGGCKKSPRTTSLCSHIFQVLMDHGVYMYVVYIWKWSSAHAPGGSVVWHYSLLLMSGFNKTEADFFLVQAMLPEVFPFHQFNDLLITRA